MNNMRLLGKRVIFREIVEEKEHSPLIPVEEKSKFIKGEIIEEGEDAECVFKGHTIYVNRFGADNIVWEGENCFVILEQDIIAYE